MSIYSNSTILITGGTGTIGNILVKYFINQDIKKLIVYSRDENKFLKLQREYNSNKIEYIMGDILDHDKLVYSFRDVDYVIHTAAMKHVGMCESNPIDCIKTNVIGTENVIKASILNNVKKLVVVSSDKAVNPTCVYGYSKNIMENICRKTLSDTTSIVIVRPVNLLYSTSNVTSIFLDRVLRNEPLNCTNTARYFMTSQQVLDLILYALDKGKDKYIIIKDKLKMCEIETLAKAMIQLFNPNLEIRTIDKDYVEKKIEDLITVDEEFKSFEDEGFVCITDKSTGSALHHYSLLNTLKNINFKSNDVFMDISEITDMLLSEDKIKEAIKTWR